MLKKMVYLALATAVLTSSCRTAKPAKYPTTAARDSILFNSSAQAYNFAQWAQLDPNLISTQYYPAAGQDERIRFLILHYTALNSELSKRVLSKNQVSAHYLVDDKTTDSIYLLVEEQQRSWHAGLSQWKNINNLNFTSIGIEIVNPGYDESISLGSDPLVALGLREFKPFEPTQIQHVASLMQNIIQRHQIKPQYVLGHSDIAPQRKHDPGPKFPWEDLYRTYQIGAWYELSDVLLFEEEYLAQRSQAKFVEKTQQALAKYGYDIKVSGVFDAATQRVLAAFQYHFRPNCHDGIADAETWAILQALLKKYP